MTATTQEPERRPARVHPLRARARAARARLARLPVWWLLPVCALLGTALGGTYGLLRTAQYTATSYVLAVADNKSEPTAALGFAQAYGRVATQLAVLADAQVAAGVPVPVLRANVRTATSPDAPMVAVSATAEDPADAADMANSVSAALTSHANRTRPQTGVRLLQLSRAVEPSAPSSPSPVVTALVGTCAGGLLAGLGLLVRPGARGRDAEAAGTAPRTAAESPAVPSPTGPNHREPSGRHPADHAEPRESDTVRAGL